MEGYESVRQMFLVELENLCRHYDQKSRKVEFDVGEDMEILVYVPSPDGTISEFMLPINRPFDEGYE